MKEVPYIAPNFSLVDDQENQRSLADYRGQWLVLYFYPKDDTPGCTTEACSMRDAMDEFARRGIAVVGVSADDVASHAKFKAKYNLNFTLLSDPDHATIEAYGAWGKKMFGKEGIQRKTFVIDPNGRVVKIYGRVTPLGHAEQVLAEVEKLSRD